MKRFRRIAPSDSLKKKVLESATEKNTAYLDRLSKLDYKGNRTHGVIRVIGTVAAAVAILTLFTVWALIGRGIRGTETVEPTPSEGSAQYIGVKENEWYYVAVDTDGNILSGKEQLQSFFDAYMSGKGCNLDLFVSRETHTDADGISQNNGTSYQYTLREDGSGDMEFYNGTYEEGTLYSGMTWYSDAISRVVGYTGEFNVMRFIFLRDTDTYYISTSVGTEKLDMSFIETTHSNSEKIYDSANGEEDAVRFLKMANSGTAAFYKAEDGTFISNVYTEISATKDGTVTDDLELCIQYKEKVEINLNYAETDDPFLNLMTLSVEQAFEHGILFDSYRIEVEGYTRFHGEPLLLYYEHSARTQIALTDELIFQLKQAVPADTAPFVGELANEPYRTLVFDTGTKLSVFTDTDGSISKNALVGLPDGTVFRAELNGSAVKNLNIAFMPQELTDEQTEMLNNIAVQYKFSLLPNIDAGTVPYYAGVRKYAYALYGSDTPIKGHEFNNFTNELFAFEYEGIGDDYNIPAFGLYDDSPSNLIPARAYITEEDDITLVYAVYDVENYTIPEAVVYTSLDGGKTPYKILSATGNTARDEYYSKRIQEFENHLKTHEEISEYFIRDFTPRNTADEFGIYAVEVALGITYTDGSTKYSIGKTFYYTLEEDGSFNYIGEYEDKNNYLKALVTEKYTEYLNRNSTLRDVKVYDLKITADYTDPQTGYFLATAKYDVKPKLFHYNEWVAGGGTEDGSWIRDNLSFIYFAYEDGEIVIKSHGTGP